MQFRSGWSLAFVATLLLSVAVSGATVVSSRRTAKKTFHRKPLLTTVMYIVNTPNSIASFRAHAAEVSIAAPQCFTMDAQGFVGGQVPPAVLAIARAHHVALMPLVTNRGFSQPIIHTVLDTPASSARAIRYLIYYARRDGYIGFQFDYEHIHYTYRRQFSDFLSQAAMAFHREHLLLSVAVVARYSDSPAAAAPGGFADWAGAYDYRAIGRAADFVSVMAYPQHAGFSGPGSLAGYDWVGQVLRYTLARIPARKISLGVPTYGLEWSPRRGRPSSAAFAQDNEGSAHLQWRVHSYSYESLTRWLHLDPPHWDATDRAHYLTLPHGRQLWYEDSASLGAKLDWVSHDRLAGISAWRLGMEDPAIWPMLARRFRIAHPAAHPVRGSFDARSRAAGG